MGALRAEVLALKARLDANSSNSSEPPSTDPPHLKRRPPLPPSGKKRRRQHGHKRAIRPLVPPEQLAGSVDCKLDDCSGCGHHLAGDDPEPSRHQVAEIPEVRPAVIEYRIHRLTCPRCGDPTRGELPAGVPRGVFGPRLQATVGLLGGVYRLSKRRTVSLLGDLLGLSIAHHVRTAPAAGVDETAWKRKGRKAWL